MFNQLKNALKPVIIMSVGMLLLPTLTDILSKTLPRFSNIFSFISGSAVLLQLTGASLTSLSGSLYLFIVYKEKRAEKILASESYTDNAEWDLDALNYNTRFIFYKVQAALNSNDISTLKDYATPQFLAWFTDVLANKKSNDITNIEVDDTHVICCRDFINNDKDQYVGYIKGHLVSANTDQSDDDDDNDDGNDEKNAESFSEVYHFTRAGDNWLLNKVCSAGIWNIAFLNNKFEEIEK
ncbi:MAG TPA: hypothetical protein VHB70_11105 [Parafilimonas sp.]|nr:hypothetical protein [Parafilimonas sp.]